MKFSKLSKIDKAFLIVLAGILSVGIMIQVGSSFSGVQNTFGVDLTGEGYVEVYDLNVSRDWFRGLVNVTDNVLGVLYDLIPDAPDTYDIGSALAEWQDIYIGTGRAYFYPDQAEYIYSTGVGLVFGASGNDRWRLSAAELIPIGAGNAYNLGSPARTIANFYLGTGKVYFWTDQAESIYSDGNSLLVDASDGMISAEGNNTGAIGADLVRWANGWFTTITAKSSVTGKVIETEISPAPWESFENGDVVKIYDSEYFVKTSKKLDYVVGVVVDNPVQVIDHYEVSWEMIEETIAREHEVEYSRNITDAYNNTFEIIERHNETVYEYYIEEVQYQLSDGSTTTISLNQSRPVLETVYTNVTTKTAIYRDEGSPVLCVAGVTKVKIIEPVFQNDILVAGPNGVARPFRGVVEEIKANYGGIPFNWNNVLEVIENFNMRTLGQVMEDSSGDYAQVMLW